MGGRGEEDGSGDELSDGEGGHLLQLVPPPGGGAAADQRDDAQLQHLAQLLRLLYHSPQDQGHHMRGNLHENTSSIQLFPPGQDNDKRAVFENYYKNQFGCQVFQRQSSCSAIGASQVEDGEGGDQDNAQVCRSKKDTK